jgi:hypothetical protein
MCLRATGETKNCSPDLVLHAGLDQVDGVDGRGTASAGNGSKQETVGRLHHLHQDATLLRALEKKQTVIIFLNLPPYTLAGFDLTTHCSSLLGGRWRRCH